MLAMISEAAAMRDDEKHSPETLHCPLSLVTLSYFLLSHILVTMLKKKQREIQLNKINS